MKNAKWTTGRVLNLQQFADEIQLDGDVTETDGNDNTDIDTADNQDVGNQTGAEFGDQTDNNDADDLLNIIRQIKEQEAQADEPEPDDDTDDQDDADTQDTPADTQVTEQPTDENPADTQDKPVQSAEENARFAELRRQQQMEAALKDRPEYKVAEKLAQRFGKPVDQILADLEEAELTEQAAKENVPVEVLKEQRRQQSETEALKTEVVQLKFNDWNRRMDAEGRNLTTQYPVLTQADIDAAKNHMLTVWGTDAAKLEDAVMAVHSSKILGYIRNANKQEALAEVTGRKKGPLAPNGTRSTPANGLSADETVWAKRFGLSDEEYKKWQS